MSAGLWQRVEGALVFAVALGFALWFGFGEVMPPWWQSAPLFFAPDLSSDAYLAGPRVVAAAYNLVLIYGFGMAVVAFGILAVPGGVMNCLGLLWVAHAGFDRMLA